MHDKGSQSSKNLRERLRLDVEMARLKKIKLIDILIIRNNEALSGDSKK